MSQARARTRSARSGVERTNHEATAPPVEIHEMSVTSINKTMTKESKLTKTKTFVFVVALKRAVFQWLHKEPFYTFSWNVLFNRLSNFYCRQIINYLFQNEIKHVENYRCSLILKIGARKSAWSPVFFFAKWIHCINNSKFANVFTKRNLSGGI